MPLGETFPSNLSFSLPLSATGDVAWDMAIDDSLCRSNKLFPKQTDYILLLGHTEIQGGIITGVDVSDVESEMISISGNDYLCYLEGRWYPFDPQNLATGGYIAPVNTDVFTIVEDLLDATLALPDSLPLTYNNGLSGQTINDFKIPLGDTEDIKSKIEALSKKLPGFDYEITWDREFKMYPDKKGTVKEFTFEQGRNIYLLNYSNRGPAGTHTLGVVQGSGNKIARSATHAGVAAYRRWDVHEELSLVTTDGNVVQATTDAESERNIAPRLEFAVHFVGEEGIEVLHEVETGDRVPVNADLGWIQVDDYMRVVNIQGTTDDEGNFELIFTFDDGTIPQ
jgi:hypothetical protein